MTATWLMPRVRVIGGSSARRGCPSSCPGGLEHELDGERRGLGGLVAVVVPVVVQALPGGCEARGPVPPPATRRVVAASRPGTSLWTSSMAARCREAFVVGAGGETVGLHQQFDARRLRAGRSPGTPGWTSAITSASCVGAGTFVADLFRSSSRAPPRGAPCGSGSAGRRFRSGTPAASATSLNVSGRPASSTDVTPPTTRDRTTSAFASFKVRCGMAVMLPYWLSNCQPRMSRVRAPDAQRDARWRDSRSDRARRGTLEELIAVVHIHRHEGRRGHMSLPARQQNGPEPVGQRQGSCPRCRARRFRSIGDGPDGTLCRDWRERWIMAWGQRRFGWHRPFAGRIGLLATP